MIVSHVKSSDKHFKRIDGICYVIDSGFNKQNNFDAKSGVESLIVTPVSQAAANQVRFLVISVSPIRSTLLQKLTNILWII